MKIKKIIVGELQTNCYVLIKDKKVLVIDPGASLNKIIDVIGNNEVIGIIITHYHFDHIGAMEGLVNKYKCKIYDQTNLEEKTYEIGPFKFEVIYTFGHTDDSITLYFKKDAVMFTGDFLFKNSIGRYDLETGSYSKMLKSIEKIKKYPKDIIIYPGHGLETILGDEIKNNYFLNLP